MAEKNRKKVRNVATPKQTGGGGFVFEDKVTAWFVIHFLADTFPFFKEAGKIKRIDFQVRPEGWLFDDLLLTQEISDSEICKVAVSIKSNAQFNTTAPAEDLLYDIWNQYVGEPKKIFNPLKDYLCIVNSIIPYRIKNDLMSLLDSAKKMDPLVFFDRISDENGDFSIKKKELFEKFHCPPEIAAKFNIGERDTVHLLSRLLFIEFDFQNTNSNSENSIIKMASDILSQPDGKKEVRFYESLCSIRSEFAPVSGFLDYEQLIMRLRNHYDLAGYPNHVNDWLKIYSMSKLQLSSIPDSIGNKLSLPRTKELQELKNVISNNKVVFVLGRSGYGKSTLVKKLIQHETDMQNNFVWIDTQCTSYGSLSHYFGLQHTISDLFKYLQRKVSYLIVDGVDRFFKEEQFTLLYEIITTAIVPDSGWKIIFTCQNDDYSDVIERLYRQNISIESVRYNVTLNILDYVSAIREEFPKLSDLFRHKHLHTILNNLKYLDLLAFKLSGGTQIPEKDLIGETTIIDWIWKEEFDSTGSRFMQDYGEKQAVLFSPSVPITDYTIAELAPLDQLKVKKIVYENNDKLYLVHDLFGDWARYKLLRSKDGKLKDYLVSLELVSPLWRKAIRLYGIYLLEKNDNAISWKSLMLLLSEYEPKEKIIQDLLLESIFFSASTNNYLSLIFDYLKEDKGKLFRRFIGQFLMKATVPNQNVMKIAKEMGSFTAAEASSLHRIPDFSYWPELILFLYDHKEDMSLFSREQIAIFCSMWLDYTSVGFPYREEIATIALENAEWMFDFKFNGGFVQGTIDELIYKAFLSGVNEYPDRVIELALKLCKRIKVERPLKEKREDKPRRSLSMSFKVRDKMQWPDGPYENVDDAFEKVCLNKNALDSLVISYPQKASEILLALLIESPREVSFGFDSTHYHLDINEQSGWFPPFYTRGPFLQFLKTQPLVGIDMIIRFVNFATQQWTNEFKQNNYEIPQVKVNINGNVKNYIGDSRVYYWFRDIGNVPNTVVSALEALEKFILDTIDKSQSIDDYIEYILAKGDSVAFLGLLNSVGKYEPSLFIGKLKEMLSVLEFYFWEKDLDFGGHGIEGHQMIGSNNFDSKTWKLAKEWHELAHRKKSIGNIAIQLYLTNIDVQNAYISILENWTKILGEIEKGRTSDYLKRLISFFKIENYELQNQDGQSYVAYKEPPELTAEFAEERTEAQENLDLYIFPFQCFQSIENKRNIDLNECKSLWEKILEISKMEDDDPFESNKGKHQMVLAGCGLLFYNKEKWIQEYPEILEWTLSYIENILSVYKPLSYEMSQADIGYSWNAFTARILALIWTSDLNNKRVRKVIARLITKCSYDTITILFKVVAEHLNWSDKNFIQLQNLLILWAIGIDKRRNASKFQYQTKGVEEKNNVLNQIFKIFKKKDLVKNVKEIDIGIYTENILMEFTKGRIQNELIDWSKNRIEEPIIKKNSQTNKIVVGNFSGIDKDMLQHAFVTLPDIVNLSDSDRKHVCLLLKRMLEQVTFELGEVTQSYFDGRKYPQEFDYWILQRISGLILDIKVKDNFSSENFWKPIMAYGYKASDWINLFMQNYFTSNIEREDKKEIFFSEWKKMITFANNCDTWDYKKLNKFREKEIHESLMSISSYMIQWWKNDNYSFFYDNAIFEVIKWGQKRAYDQDVIYKILFLLMTKPGIKVLKDGVNIVNRHLNLRKIADKEGPREGYVRRDFEHEDYLAKSASFLWENYNGLIKGDSELLNGFKEIVTFLVSRQNTIGLELQERVLI